MKWLENIRRQPYEKKVRLIWTIAIITTVFLIILWVISNRFRKSIPADTTFFDTIGRGIHDIGKNYKDIPSYIKSQQQ